MENVMYQKEFAEVELNYEISTQGFCTTKKREALVEIAISKLQTNPEDWAKEEYFGIKNYAQFGDQRADCSYGMGPTHGSIVFRIGRGENFDPGKKDLYVEYLIYFRDFRNDLVKRKEWGYLDLHDTIREHAYLTERLSMISKILV
jgi:hypothetical protein